jgi:hypothetical protein
MATVSPGLLGIDRRPVSRVSRFPKSKAIPKRLSGADMTICDECKNRIWFLPKEGTVIVSHTDRGGSGRRDTQWKPVVKCWRCHRKEIVFGWMHDMTREFLRFFPLRVFVGALAVIVILGALTQYNTNAPSQVPVEAFAPKAAASKPILLIPPENSGAR